MKKRTVGNKGFTLMELVIGMCLLGFIIAMTAPLLVTQYKKWSDQADAEQIGNQMNNMAAAAAQMQIATGGNPGSIAALASTYIAAVPVPPSRLTGAYALSDTNKVSISTPAAGDKSLCQKFNELYAGKASDAEPAEGPATTLNLQCTGAGTFKFQGVLFN